MRLLYYNLIYKALICFLAGFISLYMMGNEKYKLIENKSGYKYTYTIQALKDFRDVKAGDLGGIVDNPQNLSQEGDCWIYPGSQVSGNVQIRDNATVSGKCDLYGYGLVSGNVRISGEVIFRGTMKFNSTDMSSISGNARISGNVRIEGICKIFDEARIYGNGGISLVNSRIRGVACVHGGAKVYRSNIYGSAEVHGFSTVFDSDIGGRAEITEHASVSKSQVYENAFIGSRVDMYDCDISGNTMLKGGFEIKGVTLNSGTYTKWGCSSDKYEILPDNILQIIDGREITLHRIRALRNFKGVHKGALGGLIESEFNLSQFGDCWVSYESCIFDGARVFGSVKVSAGSKVYGNAEITGDILLRRCTIREDAKISGNGLFFKDCIIGGDVEILEDDIKLEGQRIDYRIYEEI